MTLMNQAMLICAMLLLFRDHFGSHVVVSATHSMMFMNQALPIRAMFLLIPDHFGSHVAVSGTHTHDIHESGHADLCHVFHSVMLSSSVSSLCCLF